MNLGQATVYLQRVMLLSDEELVEKCRKFMSEHPRTSDMTKELTSSQLLLLGYATGLASDATDEDYAAAGMTRVEG